MTGIAISMKCVAARMSAQTTAGEERVSQEVGAFESQDVFAVLSIAATVNFQPLGKIIVYCGGVR